jgi:multidrug efflux pump subunit AcrA (membrane-fusion protein)
MADRSPFYLVALLSLLLAAGCGQESASKAGPGGDGQRGRGQRGAGARQAVNVQTVQVSKISVQRVVDLSGTLVSPDQARVSSEVAGIVRDVLIEIGQDVRSGQELVRLDTTELNLALQRAESALRQTEAQLGITGGRAGQTPADEQIAAVRTAAANRDDARAQMKRAEELISKGLMSRAELDTVQTRVKVSEANYQAALEDVQALKASLQDRRASYDLAKKKVDDAVIRAPLSGAIAERTVQVGEFIRENTPVVTIVRMSPLKLKTGVQEKYANLVRQNQTVQFMVEPYPDEKFEGRIAFISPAIDQATRTFAAEILVDNPARRLKPGFFAKGEILVARDEGVIAVPEEAVLTLAGVASVYLIENGIVRQQTIRLGEKEGKYFEVLEGLKGDEILAASNLNELVTGIRVGGGGGEEEAGPPGPTTSGDTVAPGAGERQGGREGAGRGRRGGGEGKGSAQ